MARTLFRTSRFDLDHLVKMVRSRNDGRRVYLHCVMAESRAPSVAAAYLAERLGICGADALEKALGVPPRCGTNPVFAAAVAELWDAPEISGEA